MARKLNLTIDQGATYTKTVNLTDGNSSPIEISTSTGAAQMRKNYTSNSYFFFAVNTAANGALTLSMSANTTRSIPSGRYVYDVEVTSNTNIVTRVLEGLITVTPEVTK